MGGNKRYPEHSERLTQERELREASKHGPLQSLSQDQLGLWREPVTIVPDATKLYARAWLRFGDTDVRADVRVLRWTDHAVGVAVEVGGESMRCWVWRGACTEPR